MCSIEKPVHNKSSRPAPAGRPGRVLNLPRYATYFFTVIANELSHGASRLYLRNFGVGIFEWRIMAMLAIEPCITANRICEVIGFDKAAVSRGTKSLRAKGYIKVGSIGSDQRTRILELTAAGHQLHDKMLDLALERERRLVRNLSATELNVLLDLLRRITEGMPYVNELGFQKNERSPLNQRRSHRIAANIRS
jgi:DNA-binding MarR family transcriptional regulator